MMKIIDNLDNISDELEGSALAIGNFDGVHRGHQILLQNAIDIAKINSSTSSVMFFEPHPRSFFSKEPKPFFRITPNKVKLKLLKAFGMDYSLAIPFNKEFASIEAENFIKKILVEKCKISNVIIGYDFKFGKGRMGDAQMIKDYGNKLGYKTTIITPVKHVDEMLFSSTNIRDFLRLGKVEEAAQLLGHWFSIIGNVEHGEGRGHDLGYPTANIPVNHGCELKMGIYAARIFIGNTRYKGVVYFGTKPTFGINKPMIEPYIFDFDGDLYDKEIEVEFIKFLREDERFENQEDLAKQIEIDCKNALNILDKLDKEDIMLQYPLGRRREGLIMPVNH